MPKLKLIIKYVPPINTGLDIVYQDEYLIVLNKPNGLLSVPGRGVDKQDCLISRVNQEYPTALVVHRLDMSTSGIIVLALNKEVHRQLSKLFATGKIHKKYVAVVDGILENGGEVNQPLICDWPNRPKQIINHTQGKQSLTLYTVIELSKKLNNSRLELIPKTGRTHQLRVHMQYIGHAILGDELYGSDEVTGKADRLLLHATEINFTHPVTGLNLTFTSPEPF